MLYVIYPDISSARAVANMLLENNLVACANILGEIKSLYKWEGKVVEESETVMLLKLDSKLLDQVRDRILHNHPYEIPCLLELPINSWNSRYTQWVQSQFKP
jgi:periplasmic divalent cation tolerance protein